MDEQRRLLLKAMALGIGGTLIPGIAWADRTAFDLALEGQNLLSRGKPKEAIEVLKKATEMQPGNEWAWGLLGRAYYQQNDRRNAVDSFREVLKINPEDTYSRMMVDIITQKPIPPKKREKETLSPLEKKAREEERRIFSRIDSQNNLGYQVRRVVLDAGHGGFDPGAVGPDGLKEKEVTLDLAKRTANVLNKISPNMNLFLSRTEDYFIPLSARTATANQYNVDLFVSFHINAYKEPQAHGMETYFCSQKASSKEAARVAQFENSVRKYEENQLTSKGYVNIEEILFKFERESYWRIGGEAADIMQETLSGGIDLHSRGVHSANFYVLRRARMPSILLESGFISNPKEERMLQKSGFRDKLAETIATGIRDMVKRGI